MIDQLASLNTLNDALDDFVQQCGGAGKDALQLVRLRGIRADSGNYTFTVEKKTWLSRLRIAIFGLFVPGYKKSYDLKDNIRAIQDILWTLKTPEQPIFELVSKLNSIIRHFNEAEKKTEKRISSLEIDARVRSKASVITPTVRDLFPTLD